MKLFKTLKLNVKGLILLILIPILSVLITIIGWTSYHEMYHEILNGFDQKLIGISTTTGAFIDGDEHVQLAKAKEVSSMAFGKDNRLYGIDTKNNFLYINEEDGSSEIIFKLKHEINDLTYNSQSNLFFITSKKKILSIDLEKQETILYYKSNISLHGIVYVQNDDMLYISNEKGIVSLNANKKEALIYKSDRIFKSLAYNEEKNTLYALESLTDKLYAINTETLKEILLKYKNFPPDTSFLETIEFHESKLYSGNNHLIKYDFNTSKSIFKDFARGYRNEKSPLYKKYIEPMTAIKIETGLTYHYTQNLIYDNPDANCFYILDVQDGSEYTPIGSQDIMDTKTIIGAENVMLRNMVFISDVRQWKKWGLLKVSFAPITNNQGVVKAIAGADIDISIINKKTKEVLIETLVFGIIFILIAIVVAIILSKKIIEPIQQLKYTALRIAAGRYGDKIFIENPKELSELSNTFNLMDSKLKDTISGLRNYDSELFLKRKEQNMKRILNQQYKIHHKKIRMHSSEFANSIDGVLVHSNILYFWFSSKIYENAIFNIRERGLISATLGKLIDKVENPLQELHLIFKNINQFGYIDLDKEHLFIDNLSNNISILSAGNDGKYKQKTLKPGIMEVKGNIIFAQENILEKLNNEQINYLVQAKLSKIYLDHFSILFAIVQKEAL